MRIDALGFILEFLTRFEAKTSKTFLLAGQSAYPQVVGAPVAAAILAVWVWRRAAFQAAAATICQEAQKKSDAPKSVEGAAARMAARLVVHIPWPP